MSTYSLWRWRKENGKTLEQAIDWIAEHAGVKAVELAGPAEVEAGDPVKRAAKIRKRAERGGLRVVSYCVGAELLVPAKQQKQAVETLKRHVDVAEALGVGSMRHDVTRGFGDYSKKLKIEKTFDAAVEWMTPSIREVADYGAERGVKTSLENHGFYMQASKRVEKLIRAVDHENFSLTIDMGNFLCVNEDPVEAVGRLAKYAVMAHAKDFHMRPKESMPLKGWFATPTEIALRGAIAGHGVVDIPTELRLLKRAGYDGYLSLEFEGMEEPTRGVELGLEYLREQLEKMKGKKVVHGN
ncbi:MAG TPA: sugar phosphate isomerase/epimerase [Tepidisphaeraceae bacterium]|nr:sugar phosphate isomerase/epimerase [Tepidisphaeraceae bacterium]